jgi:hypothetical protein
MRGQTGAARGCPRAPAAAAKRGNATACKLSTRVLLQLRDSDLNDGVTPLPHFSQPAAFPPACVPLPNPLAPQYNVQILNIETLKSTKVVIPLTNSNAAGSIVFKTKPFVPGRPRPVFLIQVVAANKAGASAAQSLSVNTGKVSSVFDG